MPRRSRRRWSAVTDGHQRAVQRSFAGGSCQTTHVDLSTWGAVATVIAALVVIIGMIITVVVLRRTTRETVEQTRRSAESAALSAAAADRSSKAAEEAVGVNRETAAGVAGRVEADALAKRYQEAATQLGHDKAAVRLAGVYAMGRLADDWPEERQTCVDVLCERPSLMSSSSRDGSTPTTPMRRSP